MRTWRNRWTRRRSGRGFTLIEVLVAFAILALSLAVLMRAFSSGLHSIQRSERYATAALLARSTLEQVGIAIPVVPGELSRDAGDGFTILLRIAPASSALPVPMTNGLIVPYEAAVTVEWPGGALTLTTLRLAQEVVSPGEARRMAPDVQSDGSTR